MCFRYVQQLVTSSVSHYINFFFPKQNVKREKNFARAGKKLFHNFFLFFFLLFGCLKANFQPLSRRHPHSPNVNNCILHIRPKGHWEPHNKVGSVSPAKHLVDFEPSNSDYNALTHQATLPNYLTN